MTAYPPGMKLRPLDGWPRELTRTRKPSPFKSTFTATLQLLDNELHRLDPLTIGGYPPSVLQIALREQDFRLDGMPRANAQPSHPGVILTIEPRGKSVLSFPCDTFDHWHGNLRAVALTLEALRKINRYGVTQGHEQYRGWQAIEAKAPVFPTAVEALAFLANTAAWDHPATPGEAADVYRRARREAHPDRGDRALWDRVEAAGEVLRAAGWLT